MNICMLTFRVSIIFFNLFLFNSTLFKVYLFFVLSLLNFHFCVVIYLISKIYFMVYAEYFFNCPQKWSDTQ